MRMWMVDPRILCRKHLLGEHVETHMFLGTLRKGISIQGYIDRNLVEPSGILERHDQLVIEMERRDYNHNSFMDDMEFCRLFDALPREQRNAVIDQTAARVELLSRCPDCRARYNALMSKRNSH